MKYLNQNGYSLFLTIAIVTLISVLALGLITITGNSQKITVNERFDQSLFYIAESGINLEKTKIKSILNELNDEAIILLNSPCTKEDYKNSTPRCVDATGFYKNIIDSNFCTRYGAIVDRNNCITNGTITINNEYNYYNKQFNELPKSNTFVNGNCNDNSKQVTCVFTINSEGTIYNNTLKKRILLQTVKLTFDSSHGDFGDNGGNNNNPGTIPGVPIDNLVAFITGSIDAKGSANDVHGNVAGNGKIPDKMKVNPPYKKFPNISTPNLSLDTLLPSVPIFTSVDSPTPRKVGSTIYLDSDVSLSCNDISQYICSNNKKKDQEVTINVGSNDVNLFLDVLDLKELKLNIVGTGKLNIIVKGNLNIDDSVINSSNENQFNLFYTGTDLSKSKLEGKINGSFYSSTAPFDISGNKSLEVKGNIYYAGDGTLSMRGNSDLSTGQYIVAPNASIDLGGNSDFYGTILAKNLSIRGNTDLYHRSGTVPLPTIPDDSFIYDNNPNALTESSLEEIDI